MTCGNASWATSSETSAECGQQRGQGAAILKQQLDALVEFHQVFGAHVENTPTVDLPDGVIALRVSLIQEELNEYRHAAEAHDLVDRG